MPGDRRSEILAAALVAFLTQGYLATTMADIRRLSGATTGSIYHFFDGKPALALALLGEAVSGWAGAATGALPEGASAEVAIRASVAGLVDWGVAHPAHLRFMDELRTLALASEDPAFAPFRRAIAEGNQAAAARYAAWVEAGAVRPLPWPFARALMLGPAYDYLRGAERIPGAGEALAQAAWLAVRRA